MAGANVEAGVAGASRRGVNEEINMVPMIDLMVCCISFLLITAVWSQMARVDSNALVPGPGELPPRRPERTLHVDARSAEKFTLTWKQGATVISVREVSRDDSRRTAADSAQRFEELAASVVAEWNGSGSHRDASDRELDQAVLHAGDRTPFGEIVAIIDAIHAPHRAGRPTSVPAFNVTFATD